MSQPARTALPDRFVSPAQLARALGLSESTVKRWIDQGRIPAERTPGGHRRIRLSDAAAVFRRGEGRALDPAVLGLVCDGAATAESLQLLLCSETPELAERALESAFGAGTPAAELADRWIAPAMEKLGHRWEAGSLAVTGEHRATSVMLRAVHGLLRATPPPPEAAPRAFVAGLSGDPYLLAPLCTELVLREAGYAAENFGPDTPLDGLEAEVRSRRPALVALSFSVTIRPGPRPRLRVGAVCREAGSALIVGGRALRPDLVDALDATAWCRSMMEFDRMARHLSRTRAAATTPPRSEGVGR